MVHAARFVTEMGFVIDFVSPNEPVIPACSSSCLFLFIMCVGNWVPGPAM
jgi:hypothetical protein